MFDFSKRVDFGEFVIFVREERVRVSVVVIGLVYGAFVGCVILGKIVFRDNLFIYEWESLS